MISVDVRLVTCAHRPVEDPDTPLLATALRGAGAAVDVADWRDAGVDWSSARLTVLRSPWDYVDAVADFVSWIHATGAVTQLWNPPALVEWNVHKAYLLDLGTRGAPVVPTVVLLYGTAASLDGICDARGWNTVVVKPAVGIGGHGAGRFDVGDPNAQAHLDALLAHGDALVQLFMPSVATDGEISVVLFDGVPSHAVRKAPETGDYRVQEEWGGHTEAVEPTGGAVELAARVCAVLPEPPLYARVDMLRAGDLWHVLEVEVTEPSLFLDLAPPAATDALVRAVMSRLP
jgi:glutathione synthase/RimK-type ligase-like ATP-grasp enzyme